MPVPAALGVAYQVKVVGHIEEQVTNNILHFVNVGADADVELHLILALIQCFQEVLLPGLSEEYTLNEVHWKEVFPILGVEAITPITGITAGGVAGDALPSYCSAVCSIRTAFGGRSGRGRMYVPGIPEASTDGSKILVESTTWTQLLAFAACLATKFIHLDPAGGANLWDMSVYSRKIGGEAFPYGTAGFHAMRSVTPDRFLGTTRSRKVGRGS
jgi:hypothetical protein